MYDHEDIEEIKANYTSIREKMLNCHDGLAIPRRDRTVLEDIYRTTHERIGSSRISRWHNHFTFDIK